MERFTSGPRVLHVLEATLGGTRRYLEDLIEACRGYGQMALAYSVRRADSNFARTVDLLRAAEWDLFPLDMGRGVSPTDDLRAVRELRRIIDRFQPHVIHGHSSKGGAVARIAASISGAKAIVMYSPHALPTNVSRVYRHIERLLSTVTDLFVAVSSGEGQQIAEAGIGARSEQIVVVPPMIDTEYWVPRTVEDGRLKIDVPLRLPVIVGIGRLCDQKDPLTFIETIAHLRNSFPLLQALWVGDGELRGEMENAAVRANLTGQFRVVGWVNDVRPFVAAADLLLSTAKYESFGYVVPEVLCMERPVVATDIAGTRDTMTGVAPDLLFPVGNSTAASALAADLLRNTDRRLSVGSRGRRYVSEHYSLDRMQSRVRHLYGGAVHGA